MILVDKPAGPTSHDVVARVRRTLPRGVKVGHGGTLDPFATGLLLVLVGRATRIQRFLMELPKEYETGRAWGGRRPPATPRASWCRPAGSRPPGATLPTGLVRQRPPAYSAIKIGGRRAYAMARAGEEVEIPEREVRVDAFEQLWREDDRAAFRIACSSGTYVRSLIMDLGDAYCLELRRTAIGPFTRRRRRRAAGPRRRPAVRATARLRRRRVARVLPTTTLDDATAIRAGHGQTVPLDVARRRAPAAGPVRRPGLRGPRHRGHAKPRVGFRA